MAEVKKGGIGGWLSALMGTKPKSTVNTPEVSAPKPVVVDEPKVAKPLVVTDFSKEDSVKEDITKLKTLFGKYKVQVAGKVAPISAKSAEKINTAVQASSGVVDKPFYKKLLNIFFVLFFILILIYIAATLFNIFKRKQVSITVPEVSPTPVVYEPIKPSVYAKDEVILKLEGDASVLEKELQRISLREVELAPPRIDFDISFLK